jgi:hypothetical protein
MEQAHASENFQAAVTHAAEVLGWQAAIDNLCAEVTHSGLDSQTLAIGKCVVRRQLECGQVIV